MGSGAFELRRFGGAGSAVSGRVALESEGRPAGLEGPDGKAGVGSWKRGERVGAARILGGSAGWRDGEAKRGGWSDGARADGRRPSDTAYLAGKRNWGDDQLSSAFVENFTEA
jgi:hypothetical protein